MVSCLEMLDGMPARAVSSAAKSSTDETDPDVLPVVTLITFYIHSLGLFTASEI